MAIRYGSSAGIGRADSSDVVYEEEIPNITRLRHRQRSFALVGTPVRRSVA